MINEDKKIDILLESLKERYNAIHTIRERVQNIILWIVGILLVISGWVIQNNILFTNKQKIVYTGIFILVVIMFRFSYFYNLQKGFNSQRIIASDIEDSLFLYEPGIFNNKKEGMYPKGWRNSGKKGCEGNFFFNNYLLLYFAATILISVIWLKGSFF